MNDFGLTKDMPPGAQDVGIDPYALKVAILAKSKTHTPHKFIIEYV